MKTYILILVVFLFCNRAFAQSAQSLLKDCNSLYIWDFADIYQKKTNKTATLTTSVEQALIRIKGCAILERNRLPTLLAHVNSESGKSKLTEEEFKKVQISLGNIAKLVLFGTVNTTNPGNYLVTVEIIRLSDARKVAAESVNIKPLEIFDAEKSAAVMDRLVAKLLNLTGKKTMGSIFASGSSTVLGGYSLIPIECIGNAVNQTVSVTFTIENIGNPNHQVMFSGSDNSKAGDENGGEYILRRVSVGGQDLGTYFQNSPRMLNTGGRLLVTATFGQLLPSVKKLNFIQILILVAYPGDSYSHSLTIRFGETDIKW